MASHPHPLTSHPFHTDTFNIRKAAEYVQRTWNDDHTPVSLLWLDKRIGKFVIVSPEHSKKILTEYCDSDPRLMSAFKRDEEEMKDYTNVDYVTTSARQTISETRASLLPGKMPFPVEALNFDETVDYLRPELYQVYVREGGKKLRILYGKEEFKPPFWPDYLIPWSSMKNFKDYKKGDSEDDLLPKLKIIIRLLHAYYNIKTEDHFDKNFDRKKIARRRKNLIQASPGPSNTSPPGRTGGTPSPPRRSGGTPSPSPSLLQTSPGPSNTSPSGRHRTPSPPERTGGTPSPPGHRHSQRTQSPGPSTERANFDLGVSSISSLSSTRSLPDPNGSSSPISHIFRQLPLHMTRSSTRSSGITLPSNTLNNYPPLRRTRSKK